jgi:hypothetical protein
MSSKERKNRSIKTVKQRAGMKNLERDFALTGRVSIIAFSAIGTVSTLEAVFYGNAEHLSITLICVIALIINIYKQIKS